MTDFKKTSKPRVSVLAIGRITDALKFQLLNGIRITLCVEWGYKINLVPVKMHRAEN